MTEKVVDRIVGKLHLSRVPAWIVRILDSRGFWLLLAYVVLAVLGIWGYHNDRRLSAADARQANAEAIRVATIEASAAATYLACLRSIPTLKKTQAFIDGMKAESAVSVINSKAVWDATSPLDPQYETRHQNWLRIREANKKVQAGISFAIPTKKECVQRANAVRKGIHPKLPPSTRP